MLFSRLLPGALAALSLASTVAAGPLAPRGSSPAAPPNVGGARDLFLREILARSPEYINFRDRSSKCNGKLKVGIVGGGVAGLYAAILLDTLGIDYDILESSERIGGRIFTYRFDEKAWLASKPGQPEYYDYYVSLPCTYRFASQVTHSLNRDRMSEP